MNIKGLRFIYAYRLIGKYLLLPCALALGSPPSWAADPIWTCSKTVTQKTSDAPDGLIQTLTPRAPESLDLSDTTTIAILPVDLFLVYSGETVLLGTKPLSACHLDRNHPLTEQAMSTLDLTSSSQSALTSSDSIVHSKIYPVRTIAQMKACIAKHHPAIGYLNEVVETDQIGPCF